MIITFNLPATLSEAIEAVRVQTRINDRAQDQEYKHRYYLKSHYINEARGVCACCGKDLAEIHLNRLMCKSN